jgi:hypothetical protein
MNENPNYGREAITFFSHTKKNDKILIVRLEGLFWAENKVRRSFLLWTLGLGFGGFTLWPSKLEGRGSSWPKVWNLGLAFGGFTLCPTEGYNSYILLAIYFQPISLESPQTLAIQSHGLSIWTAIV